MHKRFDDLNKNVCMAGNYYDEWMMSLFTLIKLKPSTMCYHASEDLFSLNLIQSVFLD